MNQRRGRTRNVRRCTCVCQNYLTKEWFRVPRHNTFGLCDDWVPVSYTVPQSTWGNPNDPESPRIELRSEEEIFEFFLPEEDGWTDISNEEWIKKLIQGEEDAVHNKNKHIQEA